jgi:hypothetical protein
MSKGFGIVMWIFSIICLVFGILAHFDEKMYIKKIGYIPSREQKKQNNEKWKELYKSDTKLKLGYEGSLTLRVVMYFLFVVYLFTGFIIFFLPTR